MTDRSIETRIDELESRLAIGALVAGYRHGVDRKDGERFGELRHEAAAYLLPGGRGDFYGTEGIRESQVVIGKACTYFDKYERRDGVWKFAERLVSRWFVSAGENIALLPPF
jgi:hypothetical protein